MAIVKKWESRYGKKVYDRIVKVDTLGRFSCNLPPELALLNQGFDRLEAKEFSKLESDFSQLVKQYEESKEEIEYVIIYSISILMEVGTNVEETEVYPFNHGDCQITVRARTFEKKTVQYNNFDRTKILYTVLDDSDPRQINFLGVPRDPNTQCFYNGRLQPQTQEILYTEASRDFFNYIGKSLAKIALTLSKIDTKEKLFKNLESIKLLGE